MQRNLTSTDLQEGMAKIEGRKNLSRTYTENYKLVLDVKVALDQSANINDAGFNLNTQIVILAGMNTSDHKENLLQSSERKRKHDSIPGRTRTNRKL